MPTAFIRVAQEADSAVARIARLRDVEIGDLVDIRTLLETGLRVLVVLLLCWPAYRVLAALLRRIERAVSGSDARSISLQEQRVFTLLGLVRSVGVAFIGVIALFMVLGALGLDIGPLLAGAGVVGLAISFGAQSLVRDVISGPLILVENHVGVGDVIRVKDLSGRVERLTPPPLSHSSAA